MITQSYRSDLETKSADFIEDVSGHRARKEEKEKTCEQFFIQADKTNLQPHTGGKNRIRDPLSRGKYLEVSFGW